MLTGVEKANKRDVAVYEVLTVSCVKDLVSEGKLVGQLASNGHRDGFPELSALVICGEPKAVTGASLDCLVQEMFGTRSCHSPGRKGGRLHAPLHVRAG